MNSPYPNSRYTVESDSEISDDLAVVMTAYFPIMEGHRVTRAEQIMMHLLADDPLQNGSMLSEGLYRLVVSPLVAFYEVYEPLNLVRVTRIGFFQV